MSTAIAVRGAQVRDQAAPQARASAAPPELSAGQQLPFEQYQAPGFSAGSRRRALTCRAAPQPTRTAPKQRHSQMTIFAGNELRHGIALAVLLLHPLALAAPPPALPPALPPPPPATEPLPPPPAPPAVRRPRRRPLNHRPRRRLRRRRRRRRHRRAHRHQYHHRSRRRRRPTAARRRRRTAALLTTSPPPPAPPTTPPNPPPSTPPPLHRHPSRPRPRRRPRRRSRRATVATAAAAAAALVPPSPPSPPTPPPLPPAPPLGPPPPSPPTVVVAVPTLSPTRAAPTPTIPAAVPARRIRHSLGRRRQRRLPPHRRLPPSRCRYEPFSTRTGARPLLAPHPAPPLRVWSRSPRRARHDRRGVALRRARPGRGDGVRGGARPPHPRRLRAGQVPAVDLRSRRRRALRSHRQLQGHSRLEPRRRRRPSRRRRRRRRRPAAAVVAAAAPSSPPPPPAPPAPPTPPPSPPPPSPPQPPSPPPPRGLRSDDVFMADAAPLARRAAARWRWVRTARRRRAARRRAAGSTVSAPAGARAATRGRRGGLRWLARRAARAPSWRRRLCPRTRCRRRRCARRVGVAPPSSLAKRAPPPLPVGRDGPNARAFRERYDEMISGLVRMQDGDGGGR